METKQDYLGNLDNEELISSVLLLIQQYSESHDIKIRVMKSNKEVIDIIDLNNMDTGDIACIIDSLPATYEKEIGDDNFAIDIMAVGKYFKYPKCKISQ